MTYRESLAADARKRYEQKLQLVGLITCPYELPQEAWVDDVTTWPPLEFPDIVLYLIATPGEFTRETLKAYKSLEAYNYFASGWVGNCYIYHVNSEFSVLKAGVRPSQRTSDSLHRPWVGVRQKDGCISAGHCTCMAG